MKKHPGEIAGIMLVLALLLNGQVLADENPHQGGAMMHQMSGHHQDGKPPHQNKKHGFMPHWTQTLSDEQKLQIDKMHLQVRKQQSLLKSELALRHQELNQLVIAETLDRKALARKIDQVTELQGRLLRIRFEHIAEMRSALTSEQRLSYDMGVLQRDSSRY